MRFFKNQDALCEDAKNFGNVDEVIKLRGNDIGNFQIQLNNYIKKVDNISSKINLSKNFPFLLMLFGS